MNAHLPFNSHIETVRVGDLTFRVRLIDNLDDAIEFYAENAPENADLIPYFTMLWDSAKALAEYMTTQPDRWRQRTVLELGCGLGIPSLVAARLGAHVTATDYHPHNEPFFRENIKLNHLTGTIRYVRADWRRPCLKGPYDIILGSDLIYEETMVAPLAECIDRLCGENGTCMLADPGRDHLQNICSLMETNGFEHEIESRDEMYILEFRRNARGVTQR